MEDEREASAFYVVRKGDVVGVYRNLTDCQAQAFSPSDPSVTVYKGYGLSKEAEAFLASNGLKDACYSMAASELQNGLFGSLAICPIQDASSSSLASYNATKELPSLRVSAQSQPMLIPANYVDHANVAAKGTNGKQVNLGSSVHAANSLNKNIKMENHVPPQGLAQTGHSSCIIEFDGASKGNPGPAGAGAIIRAHDGSVVWRLREGVGIATNNVAEYRGAILGLRHALKKGFKHVIVRGDSLLVCRQIEGLWKTKNQNMTDLCAVAKEIKKKFSSFKIEHVPREWNAEADAQANKAINLRDGKAEVDV